jgi:hypothetical protein
MRIAAQLTVNAERRVTCAPARFRTRGCLQTTQGSMLVPPLCRRCEVADNQNISFIPAVVTTSTRRSLYGEIVRLLL